MSKRLKLVSIAFGVVLLLGVIGLGAAFADDPATSPTNYHSVFLSKLASILGVDEQKVTDAYTQARTEMIDQAVKDGWITQDRANWMKENLAENGFGGPGMRGGAWGGRMGGRFGGIPPWASTTPTPAQ